MTQPCLSFSSICLVVAADRNKSMFCTLRDGVFSWDGGVSWRVSCACCGTPSPLSKDVGYKSITIRASITHLLGLSATFWQWPSGMTFCIWLAMTRWLCLAIIGCTPIYFWGNDLLALTGWRWLATATGNASEKDPMALSVYDQLSAGMTYLLAKKGWLYDGYLRAYYTTFWLWDWLLVMRLAMTRGPSNDTDNDLKAN